MASFRFAPAVVRVPGAPPTRRIAAWGAGFGAFGATTVARQEAPQRASRRAWGTRWRVWWRLCAVLLAVASLFAAVEPAFAEAHGGNRVVAAASDPSATVTANAAVTSPGTPVAGGHTVGGDQAAPGPVVTAASPGDPAPDAPVFPRHGVHVCHCVHAHGAVLPVVHVCMAEAAAPARRAPHRVVRTAVQPAAVAPPVPPPIA